MQYVRKFLVCFITGIILLSLHCSPGKNDAVDRLFQAYRGKSVPGAAVLVIRQGEPLLVRTYGTANRERQIPVTKHTNFRLASLTKQFTAMAIMILKERGQLDYGTPITEIFPQFPAYGQAITIRHLLQHTSGLIAYEDLIPDTASIQVRDRDVLDMMMASDSCYFPPGSAFRYSNSGYAVLAMVIEKISGQSFARFLQKEIFTPLDMQNTVAYEQGVSQVPHRAYGYTVNSDSVIFSDQSLTSAVLGDGGIYSSLTDLYKWDQALYTEKLVSAATLQEAFTPALENYGFGWNIDKYKGHYRLHHTGSTRGFRNTIQRFPKDQFTVIILTNRREPDVAPLADKLTDMFLIESKDAG